MSETKLLRSALADAISQIAFLKAQNEALRADARRYAYLRSMARDLETGEPVGAEFDQTVDEKLRMQLQ